MADVAAAVQHMHDGGLQGQDGVLHNDLRAQNVLLQVNDEGRMIGKVRVCDRVDMEGWGR
jgi:Ser/Thr protein kinase RdoA (MazF antagonist)